MIGEVKQSRTFSNQYFEEGLPNLLVLQQGNLYFAANWSEHWEVIHFLGASKGAFHFQKIVLSPPQHNFVLGDWYISFIMTT